MAAAKNPPPDRPCSICGVLFTPQNSKNTCCGPECRQERRRRAAAAWYETHADAHKARVVEQRRNRRDT